MCENTITKLLFNVTQNGQPRALVWVDKDDISLISDAKQINLKQQVAYLFYKSENDLIELKKNGDWWNVVVPAKFTDSFEANKGLQKAFNNAFKSIKHIRDGGQTPISMEEKLSMFDEFTNNSVPLYESAFDNLSNSKNKAIKAVMKGIEGKPQEQISAISLADKLVSRFDNKFNQVYKVDTTLSSKKVEETTEKTLDELLSEVEQVTVDNSIKD